MQSICLICFWVWSMLSTLFLFWNLHNKHLTLQHATFNFMPTFSLHLSFHFVQKRKNLLGCSSPGALFFSLPYHFSSYHCLSYGRLLPPGRTVKLWLKRQIWASGVSMCSVWWAASGCWSFFQYLSPPSSLLFSSLYLASWPLQRSLLSFFTSEGGRILESALHIYKLSCFATSNTYTHFFRFWHCTTIYSFHIFHCNAILWNQM